MMGAAQRRATRRRHSRLERSAGLLAGEAAVPDVAGMAFDAAGSGISEAAGRGSAVMAACLWGWWVSR